MSNGNGGKALQVDALVDTGATYTVLPASMLRDEVGIRPQTSLTFTFANGERADLPVGEARLSVADREAVTKVVFGQEGRYLLGATSLQMLGLIPDTSSHRLIHAPELLI